MKTPILDYLFDYFNKPENFERKLYMYAKEYIFSEELGKKGLSKGREFMIKRSKHSNVLRLFDQEDFMYYEFLLNIRSVEIEQLLSQFVLNSQDPLYCQVTLPTSFVKGELSKIISGTNGLDFLLEKDQGNGTTNGIFAVNYYYLLRLLVEGVELHLALASTSGLVEMETLDVIDKNFVIDIDLAETELISFQK